MSNTRITIYDLAKELGISASYVSKALNNQPGVSKRVREQVIKKATELNYRHNSHAANLRKGSSRSIGVIVPRINQSFFSDVIAGIEEACFENNHSLIICQSDESYKKESKAIETLIHHNVDCILISISLETRHPDFLNEIKQNNIKLIQLDRCLEEVNSYKVLNDNKAVSAKAVESLAAEGYKNIAFLGGPAHLKIYRERKAGYLEALKLSGLSVSDSLIYDDILEKDKSREIALRLLSSKNKPDAFFAVSDIQSLGVLEAAKILNIKVPEQLGIIGFANEEFTHIIQPALSSIDQKSKELGYTAANLYFKKILKKDESHEKEIFIQSELILRESSLKRTAADLLNLEPADSVLSTFK